MAWYFRITFSDKATVATVAPAPNVTVDKASTLTKLFTLSIKYTRSLDSKIIVGKRYKKFLKTKIRGRSTRGEHHVTQLNVTMFRDYASHVGANRSTRGEISSGAESYVYLITSSYVGGTIILAFLRAYASN